MLQHDMYLFRISLFRSNIFLEFNTATPKELSKLEWVAQEVKELRLEATKTLIYVPTRKGCSQVMLFFKQELKSAFYTAKGTPIIGVYNAASTDETKLFYHTQFQDENGTVRVLISTTAFGMGIDIRDIGRVIHWGGSKNCLAYWQEVGRAGRGGQSVTCHMYFVPPLLGKSVDEIYKDILYETAGLKRPSRSTAHSKCTQTQMSSSESDSGESEADSDSASDNAESTRTPQLPERSLQGGAIKCFRRAILQQLLLPDMSNTGLLYSELLCAHDSTNCPLRSCCSVCLMRCECAKDK